MNSTSVFFSSVKDSCVWKFINEKWRLPSTALIKGCRFMYLKSISKLFFFFLFVTVCNNLDCFLWKEKKLEFICQSSFYPKWVTFRIWKLASHYFPFWVLTFQTVQCTIQTWQKLTTSPDFFLAHNIPHMPQRRNWKGKEEQLFHIQIQEEF